MPVEIPYLVSARPVTKRAPSKRHWSQRSVTRSVPFMGELESRTLFSAAPATSGSAIAASATSSVLAAFATAKKTAGSVVHVAAGASINSVKWPGKGASMTIVLDGGTYSLNQHNVAGNLTILSANPSKPATLKLADTFVTRGGKMIANNPSINVSGTLVIKNVNTTGGDNTVLLGSSTSGNIDAEDIHMSGGAIWRGSGGNNLYFKDNTTSGNPRANVYSSYNGNVNKCVIDHSGTSVAIPQGGRIVGGNPIGEAAIRVMNVASLTLIGVKTKPWYYKPGKEWKQDIQIRPDSSTVNLVNCTFYQCDVGDMVWRVPAHVIKSVQFINCTMTKSPNITAGVKSVKIISSKVGNTASVSRIVV